ncbi:UNVERIFIED_CONTAM: hypothetical protein FKN15_036672 [Acipenser sinensis]
MSWQRRDQCSSSARTSPPKIKKIKNQVLQEGEKLTLKCEASGNPTLTYKWYRDGTELKKSPEIKIKSGRKNSRLQISSVKVANGGDYTCEVENILGKETMKTTISIQSMTYDSWVIESLLPAFLALKEKVGKAGITHRNTVQQQIL